jgi:hypothetical protein
MLTGPFTLIGGAEGDEYCIYCDSTLSSAILCCLYACPYRDNLESLPYVIYHATKNLLSLLPFLTAHMRAVVPQ